MGTQPEPGISLGQPLVGGDSAPTVDNQASLS